MRLPILYSLGWLDRPPALVGTLDLTQVGSLTFEALIPGGFPIPVFPGPRRLTAGSLGNDRQSKRGSM